MNLVSEVPLKFSLTLAVTPREITLVKIYQLLPFPFDLLECKTPPLSIQTVSFVGMAHPTPKCEMLLCHLGSSI